MKVFLGGTCNESLWREYLINLLKIDYFNPVVEDWTPECQEEEIKQRKECDFVLYVITPKMTGVYSIAELIDDSNKQPNKTLFCFLESDREASFSKGQIKSLEAVANMVVHNGGRFFSEIDSVAKFLNEYVSFRKFEKCPHCGSVEIPSNGPRSTYACGSSDYDQRPDTFSYGRFCSPPLPGHKDPLTANCPNCSLPISWKTDTEIFYRCGSILRGDEFIMNTGKCIDKRNDLVERIPVEENSNDVDLKLKCLERVDKYSPSADDLIKNATKLYEFLKRCDVTI